MSRVCLTAAFAIAASLLSAGAPAKALPASSISDLFDLGRVGPPVTPILRPGEERPASLAGAPVATIAGGALVVEPDAGQLILTDENGVPRSRLSVGRGAAQVVVDAARARAYVSDRRGDRIVVVTLSGRDLVHTADFATRAEPYGLALGPGGETLLVTTVADRQLSAFDALTGAERWSRDAGPEPRGVAISPDGARAAVTSLTTGVVTFYDLGRAGASLGHVALAPSPRSAQRTPREDQGRAFARNAFALAFVDERSVVVPHQLSVPDQLGFEDRGSYGGGGRAASPVAHLLGVVDVPGPGGLVRAPRTLGQRTVALQQPRALAYDRARDVLYAAGFGDDQLTAIANASQPWARETWRVTLDPSAGPCGPSGIAVTAERRVLVSCELSRRVALVTPTEKTGLVSLGPELGRSRLSAVALEGRALFFTGGGRTRAGAFGVAVCASCHPEGRADGLSWRIEGNSLQTPVLAGRTVGTHPFKWDGKDATMEISLKNTVKRLGGTGISEAEARALDAFLATLERPRAPNARDRAAAARGRRLFDSRETGCATCHGGRHLSDGQRHDLASDLDAVDTPSLIGLAQSAPYYHDGSAATLSALLHGNATIHGMGRTSHLTSGQIDDLVAYLETL